MSESKKKEVKEDNIYMSLCKLQSQLTTVDKKRKGYQFMYADLSDIWSMIRKPLTDNGFSVIQLIQTKEGQSYVITRLYHVSGEFIESDTLIEFTAKKFQDVGTGHTYYRRYALSAMLGIVSDSDVDDKKTPKEEIYQKVQPKKISELQLQSIENLINGHEDIRARMLKTYKSLTEISLCDFTKVMETIGKLIEDKEVKKCQNI